MAKAHMPLNLCWQASPMEIGGQRHLRVALASEDIAFTCEFPPQFQKIINLAIKRDAVATIGRGERLVPSSVGSRMESRRWPRPRPASSSTKTPPAVRPAMGHGIGQPVQFRPVHRPTVQAPHSDNAAHVRPLFHERGDVFFDATLIDGLLISHHAHGQSTGHIAQKPEKFTANIQPRGQG